ncbi:hypothetical protein BDQ12DRAFT_635565 [Crucibulum laeve]|uniref:Tat pathway signal sequence n=1 Tax=Crucibulum laeve TaxID=68775 RepID=A0A5C3LRV0_9AGAR|nr:hypothetical protein BDQ12DRAFT_635565 [Crucibulum laeve]
MIIDFTSSQQWMDFKRYRNSAWVQFLLSIVVLGIGISATFSGIQRYQDVQKKLAYSYVGADYPENFPIPNQGYVAMAVEESTHYSIFGAEAREEWATNQPIGEGYVKMGPEGRGYAVSMFHQLHCLRLMRYALSGVYDAYASGHMHHCLNYLRQEILCSPDLTLEPADVLSRDFEVDRVGGIHVCKDWNESYKSAGEAWKYHPNITTS